MTAYRLTMRARRVRGRRTFLGRTGADLIGVGAVLLLLSGAGTLGAHGEEAKDGAPTWQSVLALQLKDEHRCDLDKVLFDRDVEVGDRIAKEGRARCLDGREYDFSRSSAHESFDIRLCQPTVC